MNGFRSRCLGATGSVGQRFVQLLAAHPWFRVAELVASERSAGKRYREATDWRLDAVMPEIAADLRVKDYDDELESPVVFSALPGEVAGEIEQRLARAGHAVLSNTSTHRMEPDVPLLIPEVNPEHVAAIEVQRRNRGWTGFIVTNPNCSAIHLVLALKPLQDAFGLDAVVVTTMQAVSGAGYPGVPSLDMIDNVVPFIGAEEEKMRPRRRSCSEVSGRTASPRPSSSSAPPATASRCATATPSASPSAPAPRQAPRTSSR